MREGEREVEKWSWIFSNEENRRKNNINWKKNDRGRGRLRLNEGENR